MTLIGETTPSGSALFYSNGMLTNLASSLGTRPSAAYSINNGGEIVGVSHPDPLSPDQAFIYSAGRTRNLGTLGCPRSVANDINQRGQIVVNSSMANGATRAFIYERGVMRSFGAPSESDAIAINRYGQITGNTRILGPGEGDERTRPIMNF